MVDLEKSPKKLIVKDGDVIKTAQELQTYIALFPADRQPEMAAQAIDILGDTREIYGTKKLFIHALGAMVLMRGQTPDDVAFHNTIFGDVYFRSAFSRFAYARLGRKFNSLALSLCETEVLRSTDQPLFEGLSLQSGVFVPVHGVQSIMPAA